MKPVSIRFDFAKLTHELTTHHHHLNSYKEIITQSIEQIHQAYLSGASGETIAHARSDLLDFLLDAKLHETLSETHANQIALLAVGGYGRGELQPHSDLDLLFIVPDTQSDALQQSLSTFITFLWDLGLDIGHSVRTLDECITEAEKDVTVITNMIESRYLSGSSALFDAFKQLIQPERIWPSHDFFAAKLEEQHTRHLAHHDSGYRLEPNVKESPGGLRDIHTIAWIAKRHFGARGLHELVEHDFLTPDELQTLLKGQDHLWTVRYLLHTIAGRKEDRLLFDYQRELANAAGFTGGEGNDDIEQFMQSYYRTVMELERLNEMLLQLFREAIIEKAHRTHIREISPHFQCINDFIEVTDDDVFNTNPSALLELFLHICQDDTIKGVRANTVRLIRNSLHLIDHDFRCQFENKTLFIRILRQPFGITHQLRRMNRYGILAAYIPGFSSIVGRMQYDLFHIYTVDEHTMMVIRNLRRMALEKHIDELPFCHNVISRIYRKELLYLMGLFHDIAKGRGGDHSELGAEDAYQFCISHGINERAAKMVAWVVRNHLLMSITAQRKDISDPEVVIEFAEQVGSIRYLNHLYVLTVADIRGTNPSLWNSFKDNLLRELYTSTLRYFKDQANFSKTNHDLIEDNKRIARKMLEDISVNPTAIEYAWREFGDDYLMRYTPDEICWHSQIILKHHARDVPLVVLRRETVRGSTEIFIHCQDHDFLFALITSTLINLGLNIVNARIATSTSGHTLDTFLVLDESGEMLTDPERLKHIRTTLTQALMQPDVLPPVTKRLIPRRLRHFNIDLQIEFDNDISSELTTVTIIAIDRPGILSQIGRSFLECNVRVQDAKISTLGERIEDVFYITTNDYKAVTDSNMLRQLQHTLEHNLSDH